jgi:hypothetical protein
MLPVAIAKHDEGVMVMRRTGENAAGNVMELANAAPQRTPSPVPPFLIGTLVGGLAGAVIGTVLSPHTRGFLVGLYHLVNRRLASSDRDQLRFELLLQ